MRMRLTSTPDVPTHRRAWGLALLFLAASACGPATPEPRRAAADPPRREDVPPPPPRAVDPISEALARAAEAFGRKDWPAALREYQRVSREATRPEDAALARYKLAWCHLNLKQDVEAQRALEQLVTQNVGPKPLLAEARKDLVPLFARLNQASGASSYFGKLPAGQAPDAMTLCELLAEHYETRLSQPKNALTVLLDLLRDHSAAPASCGWLEKALALAQPPGDLGHLDSVGYYLGDRFTFLAKRLGEQHPAVARCRALAEARLPPLLQQLYTGALAQDRTQILRNLERATENYLKSFNGTADSLRVAELRGQVLETNARASRYATQADWNRAAAAYQAVAALPLPAGMPKADHDAAVRRAKQAAKRCQDIARRWRGPACVWRAVAAPVEVAGAKVAVEVKLAGTKDGYQASVTARLRATGKEAAHFAQSLNLSGSYRTTGMGYGGAGGGFGGIGNREVAPLPARGERVVRGSVGYPANAIGTLQVDIQYAPGPGAKPIRASLARFSLELLPKNCPTLKAIVPPPTPPGTR